MPESAGLNDLLTIFNIDRKADLKAHCRNAVITRTDLANLILACMTYAVPIVHVAKHRHHHPEHLWPTDDDHASLQGLKPGPVSGKPGRFFRKIDQLTQERRLFNAHYFQPVYHPGHWHLFYWDQRDSSGEHWQEGVSHLHLINMLTHPNLTLQVISDELQKERPHFSGGLHIRFRRHD